jgi:hypothetical protein
MKIIECTQLMFEIKKHLNKKTDISARQHVFSSGRSATMWSRTFESLFVSFPLTTDVRATAHDVVGKPGLPP